MPTPSFELRVLVCTTQVKRNCAVLCFVLTLSFCGFCSAALNWIQEQISSLPSIKDFFQSEGGHVACPAVAKKSVHLVNKHQTSGCTAGENSDGTVRCDVFFLDQH